MRVDGADHEAICLRCGRCCREKAWFEGEHYVLPVYCLHFDPVSRLCTCYDDRLHRSDVECLEISEAINRQALPADCPYVKKIRGYKAAREDWEGNSTLVSMLARGEIP